MKNWESSLGFFRWIFGDFVVGEKKIVCALDNSVWRVRFCYVVSCGRFEVSFVEFQCIIFSF